RQRVTQADVTRSFLRLARNELGVVLGGLRKILARDGRIAQAKAIVRMQDRNLWRRSGRGLCSMDGEQAPPCIFQRAQHALFSICSAATTTWSWLSPLLARNHFPEE